MKCRRRRQNQNRAMRASDQLADRLAGGESRQRAPAVTSRDQEIRSELVRERQQARPRTAVENSLLHAELRALVQPVRYPAQLGGDSSLVRAYPFLGHIFLALPRD